MIVPSSSIAMRWAGAAMGARSDADGPVCVPPSATRLELDVAAMADAESAVATRSLDLELDVWDDQLRS